MMVRAMTQLPIFFFFWPSMDIKKQKPIIYYHQHFIKYKTGLTPQN